MHVAALAFVLAAVTCAIARGKGVARSNQISVEPIGYDTGKMSPQRLQAQSAAPIAFHATERHSLPQKALILVGGFGTRLRPLTLSMPKPLVPFANKPMIMHQIERLATAGVKHVVLAVSYRAEAMMAAMKQESEHLGIEISFSMESEPLGTAGPIALAREHLEANGGGSFWVLNSDVICDFPFEDMAAFHASRGAEGTILVTPVEDPSKYGVVVCSEGSSKIDRFVEKPQAYVGNRINAGVYILEQSVIDRIRPRPMSIEKEVFPAMASDRTLHAFDLRGFWMDIGQPRDYLRGQGMYLDALARTSAVVGVGYMVQPATGGARGTVMIHPTAVVGRDCAIGPNVIIGPNVVVEDGVRLVRATVLEGSQIKAHAYVSNSIVGWRSTVGSWARVEGMAVLGEDVAVASEVHLNGAIVLPHKAITESQSEPRIIM